MITREQIENVLSDRPFKFKAEQVHYRPAPNGSVLRCGSCVNLYRRAIDNFSVCQIMRSEETDADGVQPNFTCDWWSIDNEVYPRQPDEPTPSPEIEEDIPH